MEYGKSKVSPFMKQCFVTVAVGCNIVGHGAAIGYPAVLLPQLARQALALDAAAVSWIASVLGITHLVGTLVTPALMGRRGRRAAHLAVAVPGLAGWLLLASATSYLELLLGRILCGLSVGMLAPLRSALIGEYASPWRRGALLTTVSLTQSLGVFLVHLVGSYASWQHTALVFAFFHFLSLCMTLYAPESPSWLADRGRYDEARAVFRWLRGPGEEDELAEMIKARMVENDEPETRYDLKTIRATVTRNEFYRPITLMAHAYVTFNFSGATVMAGYATLVLGILLGPEANVHLWMILLDAQRLLCNGIAVFVINRYKRRTMMFSTGALAVLSQLSIALYVFLQQRGTITYGAVWLPALLINLQFLSIATGILPLPNVIGGEVFPLRYRAAGGSISLSAQSVTFFLVQKTFLSLVAWGGLQGAYFLHSAVLAYCFLVMWFLLPETRGKTLQQIEDEFRGRHPSPHACDAEAHSLKAQEKDDEQMRRHKNTGSSYIHHH